MSAGLPPPSTPTSETNTYGLIGLILSIMGFMTIIAAPIGLILSLIGLKHPQKGLAIAGTIVGIISTLYAAVITFIFVVYFGAIGAMCCFAASAVKEQQAQEQAAKAAVAPLLNKAESDIAIHGLSIPPFTSSQTASGQAVYTDDAGAKKVVDFTATFDKSSGSWTATGATIDSDPRDWVEFEDYDSDEWEDDSSDDDSSDEMSDEEESSDDFGDEQPEATTPDDQDPADAVFDESEAEAEPATTN